MSGDNSPESEMVMVIVLSGLKAIQALRNCNLAGCLIMVFRCQIVMVSKLYAFDAQ
jgi:hypothetical protein